MTLSPIPQNLDTEAAVLGVLISESDAIKQVADILRSEHFTREFNSKLYESIQSLYKENIPIDNISVANRYDEITGGRVGQRAVIATLMEASYLTAGNVRHYSRHLIDLHKRRQGIVIYRTGIDDLSDLSKPLNTSLSTSTERLFSLAQDPGDETISSLGDKALPEALRRLEAARNGEGGVGLVPYPWRAVTALTPLRPGEVTVVCGRPGMAKTSFALNTALYAARQGIPVGIFSLEMNKSSLALRLISMTTSINSRKIEKGETNDAEHQLVLRAIEELAKLPIHIDDHADLDEIAFMAKSRQAKQKYNLGLIVLDYLTLMTRKKGESDVVAVGSCARTVRKTARLLNIPIIEVCQVSRSCENRENKRPILSDLRESGEIEQEADIVLALYRDEYYNGTRSKEPGMCEVITLKHRNGGLGTNYLRFLDETTSFFSLTGAKV